MPDLADISYSQDVCIAAVRDFFTFLTRMYLDESVVMEPPPSGWPEMTPAIMQSLGKNEDVISLLRHLPYLRTSGCDLGDDSQIAPRTYFADWRYQCHLMLGGSAPEKTICMTEGVSWTDYVPSQIVGLNSNREGCEIWLLDTQLGVIYWPECCGEFIAGTPWEERRVDDDPYEWAPEKEAEWRGEGGNVWSIVDFFEMLKYQFRELRFIPVNPRKVVDEFIHLRKDGDRMRTMVKDIYRNHGWPDLERYDKQACLRAVEAALEEHYPDWLP
jgi:hypothetical protein